MRENTYLLVFAQGQKSSESIIVHDTYVEKVAVVCTVSGDMGQHYFPRFFKGSQGTVVTFPNFFPHRKDELSLSELFIETKGEDMSDE